MRRRDVHGVDRVAARHLLVAPDLGAVVALGIEGNGPVGVAAAGSGDLMAFQRIDGRSKGARDGARAEDSPTNAWFHD